MAGMRRFLCLSPLLLTAVLTASCGKKPSHPDAGITIRDDQGRVTATSRFQTVTEVQDGRVALTTTTSEIRSLDGGHDIRISWKPDYGFRGDRYDFQMTVDGVASRRSITYAGKPVVLLEQPRKVVVEAVKP